MGSNQLHSVSNVHYLPSLKRLALDSNRISEFIIEDSASLLELDALNLNENRLSELDVTAMPALRELYLDGNAFTKNSSLTNATSLQLLSLRQQAAPEDAPLAMNIDTCPDVHELRLSVNSLSNLAPTLDLLNLQYLELACAGLQSLPSDLGRKIANVRTLNLNFNGIKDLRPLLGLIRPTKLLLAGNRIARLRRTTSVLSRFQSLKELDLRENPLTIGFYQRTPSSSHDTATSADKRVIVANADTADQSIELDPYTIPAGDVDLEQRYQLHLDESTKMRRRVYELLLVNGCSKYLRMVDGLVFDRATVKRKDAIWEKLCEMGVLKVKAD